MTLNKGGLDERIPNEVVRQILRRYTFEEDGHRYITTATLLQDMEDAAKNSILDRENFLESCLRIGQYLKLAWRVLSAAPIDFDRTVKTSIAVTGELLSDAMNFASMKFKVPSNSPGPLTSTTTYFNEELSEEYGFPSVRNVMLSSG